MESASLKLSQVGGPHQAIQGVVRVAAGDVFGQFFLARRLARLPMSHPGLETQLVAAPRSVDLSKREADIPITTDRKSVVWGKRVALPVDMGVCRITKKKIKLKE